MKEKRIVFRAAIEDYGSDKKNGEPGYYDLRRYDMIGWPKNRANIVGLKIRYAEIKKDLFLVENWLQYMVKNKGVLGTSRSQLTARFHMRRVKDALGSYNYYRYGLAEVWRWDGKLLAKREYGVEKDEEGKLQDGECTLLNVEFDEQGRMDKYEDKTRGEAEERIVVYQYTEGNKRLVRRWKGRYSDKTMSMTYDGVVRGWSIKRNEEGLPLSSGDYTERAFDENGKLASECSYVNGVQHGISKSYNKFGRVIAEDYHHKGTEIPEWVWRNPTDVTPEEILDEEDENIRKAMLELQGEGVFIARSMARTLVIERPRMTPVEPAPLPMVINRNKNMSGEGQ